MTPDVLRWPVIGPFLKWRHARLSAQAVLLVVAAIIVVHGLIGPLFAPQSLATVATWTHYRGLLVIGLLAAGNLFCFGCPLMLARDVARKVHTPRWRVPRALRNKWPSLVLFVAILFVYELYDLWALPRATAYLVLGYFGGAVAVDMLFAGAAFCKYVCPVGQFSFATSMVSPLEVRVRDSARCRTCRTVDCIKGSPALAGRPAQRGCELALFQPLKIGNMDCTFCMDCVHACPHDNVTMGGRLPGLELVDERRRSGIGRLQRRWDMAALATIFVAGGLLNALAMTPPARGLEDRLGDALHTSSPLVTLGVVFGIGLVLLPGAALSLPGARQFALALVPLGVGIWSAHYAFHFLTGVLTIVPVTQSAVIDLTGSPMLGAPLWSLTGMRPGAVFPVQLGLVLLGAAGSGALVLEVPGTMRLTRTVWLVLGAAVAIAAVWLIGLPMEMRGAGLGG